MKKLIFRLSSLGDIVLATSALAVEDSSETDWVVSTDFQDLIVNHPKLNRVWAFDRKAGFIAWIRFCKALWEERYDVVIDLHRSLRTRIASIVFLYLSLRSGRSFIAWRRISKDRLRLNGYFIFKRMWPRYLRPRPFTERFSKANGGCGTEKPNMLHLLNEAVVDYPFMAGPFICVMPASKWKSKCWDVNKFADVLAKTPVFPVILGTQRDEASYALIAELKKRNVEHYSLIGKANLAEAACVLNRASAYIGSDTGLSHLAEAVGTRAFVVFGPTAPDMGFGPWRPNSETIEKDLWCRPCGKDGERCLRIRNKSACLKKLDPVTVERILSENLSS